AGRDGLALSGAGPETRQAVRTRLCRAHGGQGCRTARRGTARPYGGDHGQFLLAFRPGETAGMKVTVLGCGSSGGVPLIGCKCAVCTSSDPKNKRTRVSIVVEHEGTRVLVDASPDLRQQFLAADLSAVDAVILTHGHADHVHGIDDLRS